MTPVAWDNPTFKWHRTIANPRPIFAYKENWNTKRILEIMNSIVKDYPKELVGLEVDPVEIIWEDNFQASVIPPPDYRQQR